ncbi:MAG: hypothetical protein IPM45_04480 [Acidimicrobiales bacterium]|nr:hypothetical protein [Acidimicrobiales bacterium]
MRRCCLAVLGLGAAAAGYAAVVRPWFLRWGATSEERAATYPGDELVLRARVRSTRAVTIEAPAADVWPWLAQMGQEKGGLYSYEWLENLIGCGLHNADRIVPEWQDVDEGDSFRLVREGYPVDLAFEVVCVQPGRALVLGARSDDDPGELMARGLAYPSWAFVLEPIDDDRCRLVVRWRSDYLPTVAGRLGNQYALEPVHFVMERRMLLGIKERAEARVRRRGAPPG